METFRTKYAYKLSLWVICIFIAILFILNIGSLRYGYIDPTVLVTLAPFCLLIVASLRIISTNTNKEWKDVLFLLIGLLVTVFLMSRGFGTSDMCSGIPLPGSIPVVESLSIATLFSFCNQYSVLPYVIHSVVGFILLAFIFSIKYIFFKKEEILN
jgi:hypothetical protein